MLILALVFPIMAFTQTGASQPSFGIYLTRLSEEVIQTLEKTPIPLESVPLDPIPLISQKDIVEYDFSTHIMKLTPAAFDKVSKIKVASVSYGIPFVVVANGRKHYMGVFWSLLSSIPTSFPHIPSPVVPELAAERYGINSVPILPPSRDVRVTIYMTLKELGLLKKGQ